MRNKLVARIIAIILALVMFISIFFIVLESFVLAAAPLISDSAQVQIDVLRREKNELDRQKREIQSRINDIEFERMAKVAQKGVLDERIRLTGLEVDNISQVIGLYMMLIVEKELEVVAAQNRERDQLMIYRNRVRSMEENGILTYLEILFESTNFFELLARWDFIADIMRADEQLFNNLMSARRETQAAKERLRTTTIELEQERVLLGLREIELAAQLADANNLIYQMKQTLETEQELYNLITEEAEEIQAEINRRVEEEERRRDAYRVVGTGQLVWPVHGAVTNQFGLSRHSDFGVQRMHTGIDIHADHGANVVAADHGTVIKSAFNSSYGHFIVVNHGNGMTTLYAHLSTRLVNAGARVNRGQLIGRVGSTGVSTRPHLHFEVSVGGTRVNPLRYL